MRRKDSRIMSKHGNLLQEQCPQNKMANDRQRTPGKGIVSFFMSRLRKSKRNCSSKTLTTTPGATTASSTGSEETPTSQREVQSIYFEPNWEYLVPSTAVDLDSDCHSEPDQSGVNKVEPSTTWWTEDSFQSPCLITKENVTVSPEKFDISSVQDEEESLQVPLSRRILVDLAQVVDSLVPPPPAQEDTQPRTRGNVSLGDSQPRQPTRCHHENSTGVQGLPTKIATYETENGISDDLSSCSGITIDSSLFQHGESIISSLFAQPHFGHQLPSLGAQAARRKPRFFKKENTCEMLTD